MQNLFCIGKDWMMGFKKRHHIANRKPEAKSMARLTAFNKHTVLEFFTNLMTIYDR